MPGPQDIFGPNQLNHIRFTRDILVFERLLDKYKSRPSVVAEGDSWFAYPPNLLAFGPPSNVIDHIKLKKRFNLLQLSSNGDEAVDMLCGESKFELINIIHRYSIDFILFSGGGNDVVGKFDFEFFLQDEETNRTATSWKKCLHIDRLERRLTQIENAYKDLIDFCNSYSKNDKIKVVTHTYDLIKPDPTGAVFVGDLIKIDEGKSWVYPYLINKKVPERFHLQIVDHLINSLAEKLLNLQNGNPERLIVADTRGTLDRNTEWLNEIHPTSDGFSKIADKVFEKMKTATNNFSL